MLEKIKSREDLRALCEQWRREGVRVVFTNGCFDVMHAGHVAYLEQAKKLGDVLVVGVNSDESVRVHKGSTRPYVAQQDRAAMLAGLAAVDAVCIFEERTPHELIRLVKPALHVKGGDYREEQLCEAPLVRELGGSVKILPYLEGRSTTNLVAKIRENHPQPL